MNDKDISFIIITNGKNISKINLQINSILNQKIPIFEIVVAGNIDAIKIHDNIICISDKLNAENGFLGALRNSACSKAKYENLVISDDDMLFTKNWYEEFCKIEYNFDILTTCVKVPDGTRFWDHCCYGSPINNQKILNPEENDDYLYMSGGQSWIMKKDVFKNIKWDNNIKIYADRQSKTINEDIDYSVKCRNYGYKIQHNPNIVVYHNDSSYTSIGRVVFRRENNSGPEWCLSPIYNIDYVKSKNFKTVQIIDLLRKFNDNNNLEKLESYFGGKLINSEFLFLNKEYLDLVENNNE